MSSVFEAFASFSPQVRGSIFYNVPLSEIKEGLKYRCELEPFNAREENSIVLMSVARLPPCQKGFSSLAHLLRNGFLADGRVLFHF